MLNNSNTTSTGEYTIDVPNGLITNAANRAQVTIDSLGFTQNYPFIRHGTSGDIVVDFLDPTFSGERLRGFVDNLLNIGYKFVGVNFIDLETLIYETPQEIREMFTGQSTIIAKGITTVNRELIKQLYTGNRVHGYGESCEKSTSKDLASTSVCFRWPTLTERDITKIKQLVGEANFNENLSFDDFYVFLWTNGIRYGIDQPRIEHHLRNKGTRRNLLTTDALLRVASPKAAVEPKNDEYTPKKSPHIIPKRILGDSSEKMNIKDGKEFPQAKEGEELFVIVRGVDGVDGIGVDGNPISAKDKAIRYIVTNTVFGEDSSDVISDGQEYIAVTESEKNGKTVLIATAKEDIFISESSEIIPGTKYKKPIFSKDIVHKKPISAAGTGGNVVVANENSTFHQIGDIQNGFSLEGWNIKISRTKKKKSDIAGEVIGKRDITVDSSILSKAKVTSLEGNITIKNDSNVHSNTELNAINGTVTIEGNVAHTIIKADTIIIRGNATKCKLIGRIVIITGEGEDKGVGVHNTIAAESITVKKDASEEDEASSYVVLVPYAMRRSLPVLEQRIQDIKSALPTIASQLGQKVKELREAADMTTKQRIIQEGTALNQKKVSLELSLKNSERIQSGILSYMDTMEHGISVGFSDNKKHTENIYALPINLILQNELYDTVNLIEGLKEEEQKRKRKEHMDKKGHYFETLINPIKEIISKGGDGGVTLKQNVKNISIPQDSCFEQLRDALAARAERAEEGRNKDNGRVDSRRETLLEKTDAEDLFTTEGLLRQKPIPPIGATIEGNEHCFLADISERGSSFVVPKEMNHIKAGAIISIHYALPFGENSVVIDSSFRVTRVEEHNRYNRISGEYLDSGFEKTIGRFLIYAEGKRTGGSI